MGDDFSLDGVNIALWDLRSGSHIGFCLEQVGVFVVVAGQKRVRNAVSSIEGRSCCGSSLFGR